MSVLKLLRKLNVAVALVTFTPMRSSTLSLIPSWSGMKTLLGALSDIAVVVTHIAPSPGTGFVAIQPGGNAGAVTLSQFSMHGAAEGVGLAEGDGDGVPPTVAVGVGVPGVGVETGPLAAKSYASTKPTPVPLFTPESKAVYWPGTKVA